MEFTGIVILRLLVLIINEGNEIHLQIKRWEHLQNPVPVYDFAVEDYHTYFAGSTKVLVHNMCDFERNPSKPDFIVTPDGVVMDMKRTYNLVGEGTGRDWFQIHNIGRPHG